MEIHDQLFQGNNIILAPIDHENDAVIEAKWTEDPEFLSMISTQPVRPLAAAQVKKKYEQIEKKSAEERDLFYFTIRPKGESESAAPRLIGFAKIEWIDWTNGNGLISLGIGDKADRQHGYGTEALQMLIHFAFTELNLFRLSAQIPEYNLAAHNLFTNFGFVEEARRRGSLNRGGSRWDYVFYGLLRSEWKEN